MSSSAFCRAAWAALGNRLGLLKLASQGLPERFSSLPCSAHRQRGIFRNLHTALLLRGCSWTGKDVTKEEKLCIQTSHAWSSEQGIAGPHVFASLPLLQSGGDTQGQAQQVQTQVLIHTVRLLMRQGHLSNAPHLASLLDD